MGAGGSLTVPPEVQNLPKSDKAVNFKIEYCGSWGGRPEANYTADLLKTVFPKANIEVITPGHTNNLVIYLNGKEIYNRKKGDERLHKDTAVKFLEKVSANIGSQWSLTKNKS